MPELPEVQTIVNDLKKRVCGRTIIDVWSDTLGIIKPLSLPLFKKEVKGFSIIDVVRKGKNVVFYLQDVSKKKSFKIMLAHQKMTGHFLIGKWRLKKIDNKIIPIPDTIGPITTDKYNAYIRVIFYLDNGLQLGLSDLRKFAKIVVGDPQKIENSSQLKKLGPDALSKNFNVKYFYSIIKKRNKPIKSILLDQDVVSGIGNIYADESFFISKIYPKTKSSDLSQKEVGRLIEAIKWVLKKSLRLRGTSSSDYRDTYGKRGGYDKVRLVYQREKQPCLKCKTPIKRMKIGQRSSHFCPKCQKEK